ncbi:type II toxin-antitoxin system HicA family toxin [Caminibacter pacificus]|uniref:Addiction module toxin, HicA family n=1 Tax=Caminibacter pacificus TaxID=1424653 RepID=A0AAJ4RD38_9BACT|nr:type II toxin-antitoxin system HicA family toxin [Caminibacter pacificus]QCI28624.1 addiction module toxin, HicA family [Caminibacter pacificus]ROR40647.1 putative RNA binding protein YcfA (HicA-like mRNA interferase family) [Caminibacter pacificus]
MKLTNITGREFIKILKKLGFYLDRQNRGNHRIFKNDKGEIIVVPAYKKKVLKPGLLKGILSQLNINKDEFIKLRDMV